MQRPESPLPAQSKFNIIGELEIGKKVWGNGKAKTTTRVIKEMAHSWANLSDDAKNSYLPKNADSLAYYKNLRMYQDQNRPRNKKNGVGTGRRERKGSADFLHPQETTEKSHHFGEHKKTNHKHKKKFAPLTLPSPPI
jgi:hypothetical protein